MKRNVIIALFTVGLFFSVYNSTLCQAKFGVGVSLNPTSVMGNDGEMLFLPVSMMNLYVPIQFGSSFRIEPEFGIYSQTEGYSYYDTMKTDFEISFTRIGVGVFYTSEISKQAKVYFGPRISVLMMSSKRDYTNNEWDDDDETSQNVMVFGGSLGGEYYLIENFSLGLEVQLNYFNYGEPEEKRNGEDSPMTDYNQSVLTTNGLIFARFFF